jgi:hypothetical protein
MEYMVAMNDGARFPPVVVFKDDIGRHRLAEGFHRYEAHFRLLRSEIEADVREGSLRDAVLFSCGANATHGLRRTGADKRLAVKRLLDDAEWSQLSDHEIARRCVVGRELVAELRSASLVGKASEERRYRTKHGTVSTMRTAKIGRSPLKPKARAEAPAPSVEAASAKPQQAARAWDGQKIIRMFTEFAAMIAGREKQAAELVHGHVSAVDVVINLVDEFVVIRERPLTDDGDDLGIPPSLRRPPIRTH